MQFPPTPINYLFLHQFLSAASSQIPFIDFIPLGFHIYEKELPLLVGQ
jgi:hypothetical protein